MPTEFCIDQRGNIRTVGFSWRYFVRRIHETAFSRSYFAPLFYQDQNERQLRSPGRYNYHIFSGQFHEWKMIIVLFQNFSPLQNNTAV
jgi:hypothetical protein